MDRTSPELQLLFILTVVYNNIVYEQNNKNTDETPERVDTNLGVAREKLKSVS